MKGEDFLYVGENILSSVNNKFFNAFLLDINNFSLKIFSNDISLRFLIVPSLSGILDESYSCSLSIVKELHLERETISEVGNVSENKSLM